MEGGDHRGGQEWGGGGGGGVGHSKNYPFCMYLDLKSSDHKKQLTHKPTSVVTPKVMHKMVVPQKIFTFLKTKRIEI